MEVPFLSLQDVTNKNHQELSAAVNRVVSSGWYLQGNETKQFENTVSRILHKNPNNKEIADKIMNSSMTSEIKFLIDLIKDNL